MHHQSNYVTILGYLCNTRKTKSGLQRIFWPNELKSSNQELETINSKIAKQEQQNKNTSSTTATTSSTAATTTLTSATTTSTTTTTAAAAAAAILQQTQVQLEEYFSGTRTEFDVPLDLSLQGTEFQRNAWTALAKIPFGETKSYKAQAALIGKPNAIRAVGTANGKNPIPIILPCHRVIGSDGGLHGFAGGLDKKRLLLDHEVDVLAKIKRSRIDNKANKK